jgi:hypothetical protein
MSEKTNATEKPDVASSALKEFTVTEAEIKDFIAFISLSAYRLDLNAKIAREVLDGVSLEDVDKSPDNVTGSATKQLMRHRKFIIHTMLIRNVDNFLNYITAVLLEIFKAKPESLRSSEKIEIDVILSSPDLESAHRAIAERKVNELSYKSLKDLSDYFESRFNTPIAPANELILLLEIVEIRNVIIHNRGIINKTFLKRVNLPKYVEGEALDLGINELEHFALILSQTAQALDQKIQHLLIERKL